MPRRTEYGMLPKICEFRFHKQYHRTWSTVDEAPQTLLSNCGLRCILWHAQCCEGWFAGLTQIELGLRSVPQPGLLALKPHRLIVLLRQQATAESASVQFWLKTLKQDGA